VLHNDLYNHNFDIIFRIPSHVDIVGNGNTKVDLLARTPSFSPITNIFIPANVNVRTVIRNKWQSRWSLHPNNKLYKIYPNVSTLPPLPKTFSRLLLGHSHMTHSYLLNKDPALYI